MCRGISWVQANLKKHTNVKWFLRSCVNESITSGIAGFALGAGIDLFSITVIPNVVPIKKPYRFTKVLRDLNITTFSTAKSFALIGAVFSAAEFTIEFYQEKTDYKNDTYAAALTGGMLGRRAGKMGFVRAFGFAAFYAYTSHIYYYMEKTKAIMVT
ncbi:hypothetical protein TKK_0005872 [Trichogramma kaykai]